MKILLLGNKGQLGWELERTLSTLGEVAAYDYPEIDLAKIADVQQLIRRYHPQLIVNATAYTAVDRAESEPDIAHAINTRAPELLAEEAKRISGALVHYSTDYVFDGTKGEPYTEKDAPNPLNVYGQSKLDGERAIQGIAGAYFIFRTSWLYSLRRQSFVTKVLEWSRHKEVLRIVSDQISSPTWARSLAEVTAQIIVQGKDDFTDWLKDHSGIYHLAGDGYTSRLDWAQAILKLDPEKSEQITRKIEPAKTHEFPTPATRPLFSALDTNLYSEAFGLRLPNWQQSLALAMERE